MKKKLWTLLLALCMALSMSSVALAAEISVGTESDFVQEVVTANSGDVIVVTNSFTLTQNVIINKEVTIKADSPVTITTAVEDVFTVVQGGTLNLGANITVDSSESILYANDGTINVKSGSVKGTNTATTLSVSGSGSNINISGGEVTSEKCSALVAKNSGTATISGGSVSTICPDPAFVAAYANSNGTINVTGGTLTSVAGETITVSDNVVVEAFWDCDHDFSAATCTEPKKCACGATEEGRKQHQCVYCGDVERVAIPKTTASVTTGTATGDTSAPALWVGLLTVAGLAAFVADKKRRF